MCFLKISLQIHACPTATVAKKSFAPNAALKCIFFVNLVFALKIRFQNLQKPVFGPCFARKSAKVGYPLRYTRPFHCRRSGAFFHGKHRKKSRAAACAARDFGMLHGLTQPGTMIGIRLWRRSAHLTSYKQVCSASGEY